MQKPHLISITRPSRTPVQISRRTNIAHPPASGRGVIIIDDDPLYVEALSENLKDSGYDVITSTDSIAAASWLTFNHQDCDAILLDWYMPDLSGKRFLEQIRGAGVKCPVIVLSGADRDEIEDSALGCGAIDFVDKSRRFSVLFKRLEIIVGGAKSDDAAVACEPFSVGPLSLDPKSCRAHWRDEEVGLTITEFRIVRKLAARADVDFTYREIYDVVHGEGFCAGDGSDGIRVNVRSLIKRIRQKFREIDEAFDSIENYPGHGYRWRADHRRLAQPRSSPDNDRSDEDTVVSLSA